MAEKQLSQAAQWDHEFVWHPFTQMQDWLAQEPVVIERGEGVYLIDENGKKYYDGVSSLWVNIHGHNHPVLNQALKEQVDKKQFHMPIIGVCVWHRVFLSNVECHLQSSTKNCVISYKKFLLVGKSDVCNS